MNSGFDGLFSKYLQDVNRYPVLTNDEQLSLFRSYQQTRSPSIRAKLTNHNLRFVLKIANEYRVYQSHFMDLIQEGNVGLVRAIEKFDPSRGVSFTSYAQYWIRAYVLRFMLSNFGMMKIATTEAQRKIFYNLQKQQEKLEKLGLDPSDAEIAEYMDVSEKEVTEMKGRMSSKVTNLTDSEGNGGLDDLASDDPNPEETVSELESGELLKARLALFGQRLKGNRLEVFSRRFLKDEPETMEVIAEQIGRTRQRVQQIDAELNVQLRKYLEAA